MRSTIVTRARAYAFDIEQYWLDITKEYKVNFFEEEDKRIYDLLKTEAENVDKQLQ